MRVISGKYGGRKLEVPSNYDIRPTSDKVKGAIFNILYSQVDWDKAHVLDVFCGTASLGIEALSRGADYCTFIDSNQQSVKLARENLEKLKIENAEVINCDALKLRKASRKHNLIFMDPPYSLKLCKKSLECLKENGFLADNFIVVIEMGVKNEQELPEWLKINDEREYGKTKLVFAENI